MQDWWERTLLGCSINKGTHFSDSILLLSDGQNVSRNMGDPEEQTNRKHKTKPQIQGEERPGIRALCSVKDIIIKLCGYNDNQPMLEASVGVSVTCNWCKDVFREIWQRLDNVLYSWM